MLLSRSLVTSTILVATAALAVLPGGSASADDPKTPPSNPIPTKTVDRDADARAAADEVIAARAPQLHLSRHDKVHAKPTLRSDQLRFVPFERTYRGLPVVGGDFVIVVDGDGNVVHASVAQTDEVSLPDVKPSVATTAARSKAAAKVNNARLSGTRLVVLQRGDRSDLAWKTTATGRRGGHPSQLDVYVDADSGQVLETKENVHAGDGQAGYSGPNPVPLRTTKVGTTYYMTTPGASTLTCQDSATNTTFSGADDQWGNGVTTNRETGCVDALYGAQQMDLMMKGWLGRNGMDGMGGWLPMRVGLDDLNAFYDGSQTQYGYNEAGEWITSVDVVAHEYGHGVDDRTPGGISNNGTSEFVGDTFGASTEYFDNQPAPYDQRDFLVGEEINLVGEGPIRNMYNPSMVGDPNCYSAAVDTMEVHAAAGPGNHWFYLAAIGSNAAGQPASPTCNGQAVTGIGVSKTMKIMYTAMLMKTSASSYKNYRKWTLIAARELYGQTSCLEFNRVKAAWNAVSVPAMAGEATCVVNQGAVKVTNATSRTFTAGTTISPFTMTATGGTTPYTWSATGLPAGLTMSPAGQVSGSLAHETTGSYVVQVTATDNVGRIGRAWFTLAVKGSVAPACSGQRLGNPGFENAVPAPWNLYGGMLFGDTPHSGLRYAWMGGWGDAVEESISQTVRIPAGCKATLTFWINISTDESGTTAWDTWTAKAGNATLMTLSNVDATNTWVKKTRVIPAAFSGKNVNLSFWSDEDGSLATSFKVDDFAVTITAP
ncbi:M4 family metallopeptidase [Nocardioides antri]|uniref:M4 family peptidase n=1 Tax=Nocardioides antri TaxID=2607659 RepID=A0A5B1LTX0_9ACTN|nr:M4 family metallopeptidase [Nocardioides antri]KAA1424335.1 M4 family peptidase [Nocardioides antri]